MPSRTTSPRLSVTALAALWVCLGRRGISGSVTPACDNGKRSLDTDLAAGVVYWDCTASTRSQSPQTLSSIDTLYDPEPAKQICMDTPISYNCTIPNSGAYRPVMAESGEYLYCPPQRWLNNLHHGGNVFLYHPCAPLHERLILSALARSCLQNYIITPHPQLSQHTPIALVSWGRTLELTTMASSDICVWLETTKNTEIKFDGVNHSNYNLLLTWPAEQQQQHTHPEDNSTKMKDSLRQCCENTISSLLIGAMETELGSSMKKESSKQMKEKAKRRHIRETIGNDMDENGNRRTGEVQTYNSMPAPAHPSLKETPPLFKSQNLNQELKHSAPTPLWSSTLRRDSLGVGALDFLKTTLKLEAPTLNSRGGGRDAIKPTDKVSEKHSIKATNSKVVNSHNNKTQRDNKVLDIKERELEQRQTHSYARSHPKSENTGSDSGSKSQLDSPAQPQIHPDQKTASYLSNRQDCDGCKAGEHCECPKGPGPEARAAVVGKGFPRTPRTDEAVWAAGALGFLLVLLTLSVLHTRLYRHWRTMPSLYWHDPRQDYDSVADVIRRRLRIANRRRKRGRRQEYVLLPSSSSSDEEL